MGKEHLGKDDIRGELQTYIKEKNLTSLLTSILESLLIDKPDNPVGHIVKQLTKLYPEETKQCSVKPNNRIGDIPRHVSQVCSDDESETTDHTGSTVGDLPGAKIALVKGQNGRRGTFPLLNRRRSSISAEKTNFSLLRNSELVVNTKTKEEALRIQNMLSKIQSVLFRGLNQDQIIAIQNAMFLIEKNEGDVIIKQGDEGDNFYIIDQGSVNAFVKSTVSMDPPGVLVKQYGEGGSFGELAIMYNSPRAATCIAASPVVRLWALDRASFKLILVKNTLSKQRENTGFLKQVAIFSQLTDHELLTVADSLEERDFSENEVVCLEGEAGDTFYIIKEGTAVCTKKDSSGNIKEVARLSRGSYFGEIALMTSKTRQATVTSLDHLKCLKLERKTFQRVMGPLVNFLMRNMDEYVKIQAANI